MLNGSAKGRVASFCRHGLGLCGTGNVFGVVPTRNCCFGFGLFESGNCTAAVLHFAVVL